MSTVRSVLWLLWISALAAASFVEPAIGQETRTTLTLDGSNWQEVLDNLFGASASGLRDGLLDGDKSFDFRAEHVILTAAQSSEFFATEESPANLSELVQSALNLHGMVRLGGTIEGHPFDLTLAGHGLDVEGVALTSDQLDTLASALASINGLDQMRIGALVDGTMTVVTLEGDENFRTIQKTDGASPDSSAQENSHRADYARPVKSGYEGPITRDAPVRVDQVRPEPVRVETPPRIEKPEKPEKPPKIEKPERPDVHKK